MMIVNFICIVATALISGIIYFAFSRQVIDFGLKCHLLARAPTIKASVAGMVAFAIFAFAIIACILITPAHYGLKWLSDRRPIKFLIFANIWLAYLNVFAIRYLGNDSFYDWMTSLLLGYLLIRYRQIFVRFIVPLHRLGS
ncbi:hypothetical protein CWB41_15940 [Methylovirgula ligni]|nr:hypothetical protein CWB41_15940 [Methylovirgula ligni]